MPSSQKIQAVGLPANSHATSRQEGTFELGIMGLIPNQGLAINLIPT